MQGVVVSGSDKVASIVESIWTSVAVQGVRRGIFKEGRCGQAAKGVEAFI